MANIDIVIVIAILFFIVFSLYRELFQPAAVFLIAIAAFTLLGILTPGEALTGFSNEQIAVIALLLIIANVIRKTSILGFLFDKLFQSSLTYRQFLGKMMIAVSGSSAFLNNTPIVAILTPYVHDWGRKKGIAPSKLLIPLSYAAILGGTATLIGTSTNLIVNGLAIDAGMASLHIFDFVYVGVPLILSGLVYMITIGNRLLPSRKDVLDDFMEKQKEYIVETSIAEDSPLLGKSVEDAKLRSLRGLFLVEIIRQKKKIAPVSPEELLERGDKLIFAGVTETIIDLIDSSMGLSFPKPALMKSQDKIDIVEAVVSYNSFLTGKKIRKTDFRGKFDAAILGVHRNGERLSGKIGEIELKPGDLLLLISGKDFWKRVEESRDLYVVSKIKEIHNVDVRRTTLIIGGSLIAITLAALNLVPLFKSLLILLSLLIITKAVTLGEIRRSLDLNLILIAASALAIGKAMIKTGTADLISHVIIDIFQPMGTVGIMAGVYLIANILNALVTNIGAVSISFPIAYAAATSIGVNPVPFILAVAYGASSSFLNPFGYQTNLIVYGPGGYNLRDFIRAGLGLTIIYMVICISILSLLYKLL